MSRPLAELKAEYQVDRDEWIADLDRPGSAPRSRGASCVGRVAEFGVIDVAARPLPDDLAVRLAELMARRRQLVVMINAEKQRLGKARDRIAQRSFKALLKSRAAEQARIDKAIDKLIKASPLWCGQQDLLKSVPGIGDVVAVP